MERTSHIGRHVGTVSGLAAPRAVTFDRDGRLWVAEGGDASTGARSRVRARIRGRRRSRFEHGLGGAWRRRPPLPRGGRGGPEGERLRIRRRAASRPPPRSGRRGRGLARGGPAIGAVVQPAGLGLGVVDGSDSLVVSDAGNGRVQVMGLADGAWRALPRGPLARPVDACVMADGSIVTSDATRQRLDHFSSSGAHSAPSATGAPSPPSSRRLSASTRSARWCWSRTPRTTAFRPSTREGAPPRLPLRHPRDPPR